MQENNSITEEDLKALLKKGREPIKPQPLYLTEWQVKLLKEANMLPYEYVLVEGIK